jgi:YVTN family beta-propeller protein
MIDKAAALDAGLKLGNRALCMECHADAHGKSFDYETAWKSIAHPTERPAPVAQIEYKNPLNLVVSPDGREVWLTCESSNTVIVVDAAKRQKVAEIEVGGQPNDLTFSPDGKRVLVTNRLDDTMSEIDAATRKVLRTVPVGDEPHGVQMDSTGRDVYVLNTSEDSISILDGKSLTEKSRLTASRYPWAMALSPDGSQIVVTNALSRFIPFRTPCVSELTVVNTETEKVVDRYAAKGTNLLLGVDWHPSGEYAVFVLLRTKNLVPMTRLTQGWTITNGIGIAWKDGHVDQVLLDQTDISFPDPTGLTITPDGKYALVTSASLDRVAVVDLDKLVGILKSASDEERKTVFPNHLGLPTEFITKLIPTGKSPRGIRVTPDGSTAFVANCLDDTLSVIDMKRLEPAGVVDLGGPKQITKARWGEQLFHNAKITFRRQFSCHSCHPDGHVDGVTYDIEPDGVGVSPVDNRTLRGILDTAPFKWEGTNPSLQRQCGPRLAVFFTRIQPFTPEELSALDLYISMIQRPPNRYRPLGAELTPAQRRGKVIFERTMTNDGRQMRETERCVFCHPPPLYTNRTQVDVGTRMPYDREALFDVPHLNNIYDSAPYLHNGIAPTLEEIWTVYNPHDTHGVTNDLTKDQLNDLIEYIKTF